MKEPLTDELLQELLDAPDAGAFAERHRIGGAACPTTCSSCSTRRASSGPRSCGAAGLNDTFGYQIFMGQRGASRNKVLQLAFALGLTLKEADRLLQAAGASGLYCKDRRDAIIIFCLDHGYSLQKTDEELYRFGEGHDLLRPPGACANLLGVRCAPGSFCYHVPVMDELSEHLDALARDGCYRVDAVMKESAFETTQLVYFVGANGSEQGPLRAGQLPGRRCGPRGGLRAALARPAAPGSAVPSTCPWCSTAMRWAPGASWSWSSSAARRSPTSCTAATRPSPSHATCSRSSARPWASCTRRSTRRSSTVTSSPPTSC